MNQSAYHRFLRNTLGLGVLVGFASCTTVDEGLRQAATTQWAKELGEFDVADAKAPPQPGGMLFVGSSSFRLWTNVAAAFPERHVINRGFGGSQMHELLALSDRLVIPYAAVEIFVYEGDNDLAKDKAPAQIAKEFREFARRIHQRQPAARIHFVAIKPSPSRANLLPQAKETNRLIAEYCAGNSWLKFIDVYAPMLDAQGRPRAELFGADKLHMNSTGYALWTMVIRRELGLM